MGDHRQLYKKEQDLSEIVKELFKMRRGRWGSLNNSTKDRAISGSSLQIQYDKVVTILSRFEVNILVCIKSRALIRSGVITKKFLDLKDKALERLEILNISDI